MSNDKYILGCDVGNGFGYVSVLFNNDEEPKSLLPANIREIGMPTTAYIKPPEGEVIEVFSNNRSAERRYEREHEQLVRAIKTRFSENVISVPSINRPVEVSRIYAAIVRDMVLATEDVLRTFNITPIYDIVFTFPASFAKQTEILEKMQQSIESVEINGNHLKVLGRIPEPAAVAIDYLHYMQNLAPEEIRTTKNDFTVLVYDLGYGTFDTAVVTAHSVGEPYTLHSIDGLQKLGGKDFDETIYNEMLAYLKANYNFTPNNNNKRNEIHREAVAAKIALSSDDTYLASFTLDDELCEVEITRERFEQISEYLIVQTMELVQNVIDDAKKQNIKIDCVVLSGGASQMPMVKRILEELVDGEYPVLIHRPSKAVSFGASRFARGIRDKKDDETGKKGKINNNKNNENINTVMEQFTEYCYGLWMPSADTLEGEIRFMIPCKEKRPAVSEILSVISNSSRVELKIYCSKEKNISLSSATVDECDSVFWFHFDVPAGARCDIQLTALENYGIQVELTTDKGEHFIKSTTDAIKDLI